MADLATKSNDSASQKEGTRIVGVDKQGNVQSLDVKSVADDGGIAVSNTRWGSRSMGNDGLIGG